MTFIDADRLLMFLRNESANRRSCQKPNDSDLVREADTAYIEALEVVTAYVERVTEPGPTFADIERGAA